MGLLRLGTGNWTMLQNGKEQCLGYATSYGCSLLKN